MRKLLRIIEAIALTAAFTLGCASWYSRARAQTVLPPPWQVTVGPATHTACTVAPALTQMCLASDGLWLSVNGAAYVQVQTGTAVAGVTSISVNGSAPLSGAISLTIPSKATTTSTTVIQ